MIDFALKGQNIIERFDRSCACFALSGRFCEGGRVPQGGALRLCRVALPWAAFVLAPWAKSPSPRLPTDDPDIGGQAALHY